jgi:hypothetical protein
MARRFGLVKLNRADGTSLYDIGIISYERNPNEPNSVSRSDSILTVESSAGFDNEQSVITRLSMMIRDCQKYPIFEIEE